MSIVDVDYKNISFTRPDGVNVNLKVNLNTHSDLDENFPVLSIDGIDRPAEFKLFYWIDKKRWTLNEFIFFALNNNLCMKVSDKDFNELGSYGNCSIQTRVFNFIFGINFN